VPISACLPLISEDSIINILHDVSSSDIEDITPRLLTAAREALEKQWSVQEITEYLRIMNAKSDNLMTLYSKSLLPKTRTKGELIRLHEYFMPLTIVRNGSSSYNKLLQLFQRKELCMSSTPKGLNDISNRGRRKRSNGDIEHNLMERSVRPNLSASNTACISSSPIAISPTTAIQMAQRKLLDRKAEIIRQGKAVINLIREFRFVINPTYSLLPKLMPYLKDIGWKKVTNVELQDVFLAPWIAMSVDEGGAILSNGHSDLESMFKSISKSPKTKNGKKVIIPKLNRDYFLSTKDLLKYLCDAAALSSDDSSKVLKDEVSTSSKEKEGDVNTSDVDRLKDEITNQSENSHASRLDDEESSTSKNIDCAAPVIPTSTITYNEREASADDRLNINLPLEDENIACTDFEVDNDSGHFDLCASGIEEPLPTCTTALLDDISGGIGSYNTPLASSFGPINSDDDSNRNIPVPNSEATLPSLLLVDTSPLFQGGNYQSDKVDLSHCRKEECENLDANQICDTLHLDSINSVADNDLKEAYEMTTNCDSVHLDNLLIGTQSFPSMIDSCNNEDQVSSDLIPTHSNSNVEETSGHNILKGNSIDLETDVTDVSIYPDVFPVEGPYRSEDQGSSIIGSTFSFDYSHLLATFDSLTSCASDDKVEENLKDTVLLAEDSSISPVILPSSRTSSSSSYFDPSPNAPFTSSSYIKGKI
jgi:hypothetical protein